MEARKQTSTSSVVAIDRLLAAIEDAARKARFRLNYGRNEDVGDFLMAIDTATSVARAHLEQWQETMA